MKVFFDTNVLVSAFTTRGLSADLFRLVVAEHELLTGEVNLTEFRRVLRQRFKVPPAEVAQVENQLRVHTIVARPAAASDLSLRDPDDAWVLASALAGGAELLVTGDKDLLSIAERATLPIVDPRLPGPSAPASVTEAPRAQPAVVPQVVTTRALLTGAGRRSRHVTP